MSAFDAGDDYYTSAEEQAPCFSDKRFHYDENTGKISVKCTMNDPDTAKFFDAFLITTFKTLEDEIEQACDAADHTMVEFHSKLLSMYERMTLDCQITQGQSIVSDMDEIRLPDDEEVDEKLVEQVKLRVEILRKRNEKSILRGKDPELYDIVIGDDGRKVDVVLKTQKVTSECQTRFEQLVKEKIASHRNSVQEYETHVKTYYCRTWASIKTHAYPERCECIRPNYHVTHNEEGRILKITCNNCKHLLFARVQELKVKGLGLYRDHLLSKETKQKHKREKEQKMEESDARHHAEMMEKNRLEYLQRHPECKGVIPHM